MSIIAQKWAYSQKLGNPIAKSILAFLASHNFAGDQSCFRIKTIAGATDYDERTIKRGLLFLAEKNLILKHERFAANGQQLSNEYTLNIPNEYKDAFYSDYGKKPVDKVGGGVSESHPPHDTQSPPGVTESHPLNSNIFNNKDNKSSYASRSKKEQNEQRHSWANEPSRPQPKFWGEGHETFDSFNKKEIQNETTEHDSGTEVQRQMAQNEHHAPQGAQIDVERDKSQPSVFRRVDRLLEACSSYLHPEAAGVAC